MSAQILIEHARTRSGESVRAPSIGRCHRLDETLAFESSEGLIEAARGNTDTRELFHVLSECVAVLLSVSEAGKYQVGDTANAMA